jgi:hypothetical protein
VAPAGQKHFLGISYCGANIVRRDVIENGSVRLTADRCSFLFENLRPGVLLITIEGDDVGQFGHAPLDEIAQEFGRFKAPVHVFVDAQRALGPSTSVMETWTAWLAANKDQLQKLEVFIPDESKLLHLTVSIARHLSRTGNLIGICSTSDEFTAAIRRQVPGFQSRG